MNPDMNVPIAPTPPPAGGPPPQPPAQSVPSQPAPVSSQPVPVAAQPSFEAPAPQPAAFMTQPQPAQAAPAPLPAPDPAAAPQPMFNPMIPPVPAQPVPMQPTQPVVGGFNPEPISEAPKAKSKKKLFIIVGAVLVLSIIGVAVFMATSKTALIGSLSSDTYEGLTYQRPAAWIKDSSESSTVSYHPKATLGNGSGGKPTYSLKMNVSAAKNVFQSAPNDLTASEKAALQDAIDEEISNATTDILPSKSEVGCDTDPTYLEKPRKVDVDNSFLAVKFSFTCKSGTGSSATTFYYTVLDVVPNDKDIEYLIDIGAASKSIYDTNLTKINSILDSVSF